MKCRARFCVVVGLGLSIFVLRAESAVAQIRWRSGPADTQAVASDPPAQSLADAAQAGEHHFVVRLDKPVTPEIRERLGNSGLHLQAWLGDNSFFARLEPGTADAISHGQIAEVRRIERIEPPRKLHPVFARGETPRWAVVPAPAGATPDRAAATWVAIYVMFHTDVAMKDARGIASASDAKLVSELYVINGLVLELPLARVAALASDDAVMYVEPALPPFKTTNDSVRNMTQANIVQAAPYGLSGAGVTVLVYDGGTAYDSHVDFQGRLHVRDASGLIDHATHVSGTIGGGGVANPLYRGMAPGVTIESYGYEQVGGLHSGFLYTDPGDLQNDYNDAINVHGANIANNSIGTNTAANGFPCTWEGDYGATSALIDSIVSGSLGAPFRIVWANGNERGGGRCGATYHTTAPPACAKNHITVGALNSNDDSVTYFTSWGPTDDGRLKPDISAPGCEVGSDGGVTSCSAASPTSYITYCGTSMASPTVCGLSALILQDYRAQNSGRPDPRNSTLKVLLAHNAQDIDAPGPDYKSGYGSVRVQRTIDFMRTGHFVEDQVGQDGVYRVLVPILPANNELKVTLAWDDPPAAPNVVGAIVNDLDIVVLDPSGVQHFPWTLGGLANPSAPAVQTQADHVNNIEQVYVAAPTPGLWTVEIRGFSVPAGPQVFSACFTPSASGDCNHNGINDLEDIANGTSVDCNHNSLPDECESAADCNGNGLHDICDIYNGISHDVNVNHVPDECEPDCNGNTIPDAWDLSSGTSHDCNQNQIPDECDIAGGFSHDCDGNGVPDSCQTDCNQNGFADSCDLANGTSQDCDQDSVPDECQSSTDCNHNGVRDFCDLYTGTSHDVNGNLVPDDCEPDCNHNTIPDAWDLSTGTSLDCNGNSEPDECDIASGFSHDCDGNGVPDSCETDCNHNGFLDSCDIQSNTSVDCNSDGVPDECGVDCNLNGVDDACDIANGTSQDQNGDGYPDECTRLYVNWQATGTNNGATWENAFTTLDEALLQASLNLGVRQVWIAAGDYAPYSAGTFAVRNGLSLYGGFGGFEQSVDQRNVVAYPTTLDGNLGGFFVAPHVVTLDHAAAATVLDGLNIINGYVELDGGAGILIDGGSPTIKNCTIANNYADSGAGVSILSGSCAFIDCAFYYNFAVSGDGGAIQTNGPGSLTLTRCVFVNNAVSAYQAVFGRGGAVFNDVGSTLLVKNCYFEGNFATNSSLQTSALGGAIANVAANPLVASSVFYANESNCGGGLYTSTAATIVNCLFSGNQAKDIPKDAPPNAGRGGAIFGESNVSITLKSSTLAANLAGTRAGGASMRGVFHNCILWYNVVIPLEGSPPSVVEQQYRGTVTIRYSDVAGLLDGIPGQPPPNPANYPGSTQDDPLFVVAPDIASGVFTAGDLHLQTGSPCVDSGENSNVPAGTTFDLDGMPRFYDDPLSPDTGLGSSPIVDMGAYEFEPVPLLGDVNCDFVVDSSDAQALAAVLVGADSIACHVAAADVSGDGQVDGGDIQALANVLLMP